MKKLAALALLGLIQTAPALAQRDMDVYEADRRYCASGRSGMDFHSCMDRLRFDRQRDRDRWERERWERNRDDRSRWEYEQRQRYAAPPPPPVYRGEPPKLSDMQQRALDNCILLAPRDQPRCRATVMSTVR